MVFKKDLELLYGKGSLVEVNKVFYNTNLKGYTIDCTVKISELSSIDKVSTDGIKYLIEESWKFTGFNDVKVSIISNFDLID